MVDCGALIFSVTSLKTETDKKEVVLFLKKSNFDGNIYIYRIFFQINIFLISCLPKTKCKKYSAFPEKKLFLLKTKLRGLVP